MANKRGCDFLQLTTWNLILVLGNVFTSEGQKLLLTFMTEAKTWNEAWTVCNDSGGYLYKDDTQTTTSILEDLSDVEPWKSGANVSSSADFWLGLEFTGNQDINNEYIYSWSSGCTEVNNTVDYLDWHPSEPKNPLENKCVYKKSNGNNYNWFTAKCSDEKQYICQKDLGVLCVEDTYSGVKGIQTEDDVYYNINLVQCKQNCTTLMCVAYSYDTASETCYLYVTFGLYHFDNASTHESLPSSSLYVQRCYEIALDSDPYTSVVNSDDNITNHCRSMEGTSQVTTTFTTISTETTTVVPLTTTTPTTTVVPLTTTTPTTTVVPLTTTTPTTTAVETSISVEPFTTTLQPTTVVTQIITTTTVETAISDTTTEDSSTTTKAETTTHLTTTEYMTSQTSSAVCTCTCKLVLNISNQEEYLKTKLKKLKEDLMVDKSDLSSTQRALTSVYDDRTSATGIGSVAVAFLIIVFGAIVCTDLASIVTAKTTNKEKYFTP